MRLRRRSCRMIRRWVSSGGVLSLAAVIMLVMVEPAQAKSVKADRFFQGCPGTIKVNKQTRVTGVATVSGDCTIEVKGGVSFRLVDANIRVQGDLIIEGAASRVGLRHSRIHAVGAIVVSTTGDVIVSNSKFDGAEVSLDAAETVRVSRSNFKRVDEPVTIMGGTRCEVRQNRPDDIGCTIDPTPECRCFDAVSLVAEVESFLDTVPGAELRQCKRPFIRMVGHHDTAFAVGTDQQDDAYTCSVASPNYELQVLQPASELHLTEEELGACQLAIERACADLAP